MTVISRDTVRVWAGLSKSVLRLFTDLDDGVCKYFRALPSMTVVSPVWNRGFHRLLAKPTPSSYSMQSVCLKLTGAFFLRLCTTYSRECARDILYSRLRFTYLVKNKLWWSDKIDKIKLKKNFANDSEQCESLVTWEKFELTDSFVSTVVSFQPWHTRGTSACIRATLIKYM